MSTTPTVRVGSVWADNDKRAGKRTIRVDRICMEYRFGSPGAVDVAMRTVDVVVCTVLTDRDGGRPVPDRTVCIRLDRFRPTSTGYRLVTDVEGVPDGE